MTISNISNSYLYSTNYSQANSTSRQTRKAPPNQANNALQGPNLDTNSDDSWSIDELKSFESQSSTFNSEEVMSKYDTDGNGEINSNEREALKDDNALNLSLENIQKSMMSESEGQRMGMQGAGKGTPPPPPPPPQEETTEVNETTDITDLLTDYEDDNSNLIEATLSAIEETVSSAESAETLEKYDINNDGKISGIEKSNMEADEALEKSNTLEANQTSNSDFVNSVIEAYKSFSNIDSITSQSLMESIAV